MEKTTICSSPVFKVSHRTSSSVAVYLGFGTVENLLRKEKFIMELIDTIQPKPIEKMYNEYLQLAVNGKSSNANFNLRLEHLISNDHKEFVLETILNFSELFDHDVKEELLLSKVNL